MNASAGPILLPDDAQQRLDEHLDAVDEVLRRYQQSRSQRAAITDELNGQLLDMLAQRTGDAEPTLGDLDAVLSEIDPPEAYARNSIDLATLPASFGFGDASPARFNRATAVGLIWIGWCALAGMILITLLHIQVSPEVSNPVPGGGLTLLPATYAYQTWWGVLLIIFFCIPGFLAPLVTTALGCLGITQIRMSHGHQYGLGLATTNALLFPLLVADAAVLLLCVFMLRAISGPSMAFGLGLLVLLGLLMLALLAYANRMVAKRVWHRARQPM